jgi:hypothetical protein
MIIVMRPGLLASSWRSSWRSASGQIGECDPPAL